MDVEAIISLVERVVYRQTNKPLSDLQQVIVTKVLQGKKYLEIADEYGCTEGHAKDTASLLWKLLSEAWGKKVTKSNFRSLSRRQLQSGNNLDSVSDRVSTKAGLIIPENRNFLGRKDAIASLNNLINLGHKIIVLQGEGGIGKTTLAQQFLGSLGFDLVLEVLMAKETENIISVASVVEEWLQRDLNEVAGLSPFEDKPFYPRMGANGGKEFGVTLARFKRYLEHHRVGILIDNLEPALNKDGRLIAEHRNYLELLRILADAKVQSTTIVTSRDRFCEGEINLEHYRLSGLDLTAWQQYFSAHQIKSEPKAIAKIQHTYGGNAKAMGILCGIIREDYAGDLNQYWQENCLDPLVETDLQNLIASQFDRLQQLDLQAYLLLCRLGCYRYQDLPKVPQSGLFCLLWDVPIIKHRRVIRSLRNRSLLECDRGEYWLHPVVQQEARFRLQRSPKSWQQPHRQIAAFLTDSIDKINNIQAGLTALEAYYHYTVIQDYAAAAKVILYSRENQWGQFLTLGATLYRLGIIQPLLTAINQIIERVENERHCSELNNILGDLYWTAGNVRQAISYQEKTIATSQKCRQIIPITQENRYDLYYWRMLEVDSLLSLGLYNIDLWELDAARSLFQQVIDLAHNTKHHSWSEKAALGLVLINSYTTPLARPNSIISRLYRLIVELEDKTYNTGRFAYFMQILGQIFFNHQQITPAKTIWQRAIIFAKKSHYTQIEAKSLSGLGNIERQLNNFEQANNYHQQAVELLDKIGAKCDLAQAYLQWGITLQNSDETTQSNECFQNAIALFQQIQAPKQVDRVIREMES